jgi:hypothetical protein
MVLMKKIWTYTILIFWPDSSFPLSPPTGMNSGQLTRKDLGKLNHDYLLRNPYF